MNKRKLLLLVIFCFLTSVIKAQIRTCAYYDGYWGKWEERWIPKLYLPREDYYNLYGDYSGFIVYDKEGHPSQYTFKFQIDNYVPPSKKEIKEHYKRQEWYEHTGTVEYFVVESAPTIKDILKKWGFPIYYHDSNRFKGEPTARRIANATIKIAPYKKHPTVYNIWFDDVAIAIELVYVHF